MKKADKKAIKAQKGDKPRIGRPPKEFKEEYPKLLYDHLSKGHSVESFGGLPEVGVCKETIYTWLAKHEAFLDAKKRGEAARRGFLENIGMRGMNGLIPGFNLGAWIFFMKNMCGWRDRHDINTHSKVETTTNTTVTINYNDMTQDELLRAAKEKIIEIEGSK